MDQAREGQGQSLVNLGTASHHVMDRKLSPGCLVCTGRTSLANEGHIQYTKGHPVHPWPDDFFKSNEYKIYKFNY